MKRAYMKPALQVVKIQQSHIICVSDWDTMHPGQPNQPAGARRRGGWDAEDDWDAEDNWTTKFSK